MIDFDIFLSRVMPSAVACPEPLAIRAIRDAAIELCQRATIWRVYQTYAVVVGANPVLLVAPASAAIHEIRVAKFDDQRPLQAITSIDLDDRYPNWRTDTPSAGNPQYIAQIGLDSVTIYPRAEGSLYLEAVLKPTQDADELPDVLADHFLEPIAQGALSRILMVPARDFTNPQLAATHYQLFHAAIDSASVSVAKGQQRSPLRTRSRFV